MNTFYTSAYPIYVYTEQSIRVLTTVCDIYSLLYLFTCMYKLHMHVLVYLDIHLRSLTYFSTSGMLHRNIDTKRVSNVNYDYAWNTWRIYLALTYAYWSFNKLLYYFFPLPMAWLGNNSSLNSCVRVVLLFKKSNKFPNSTERRTYKSW